MKIALIPLLFQNFATFALSSRQSKELNDYTKPFFWQVLELWKQIGLSFSTSWRQCQVSFPIHSGLNNILLLSRSFTYIPNIKKNLIE